MAKNRIAKMNNTANRQIELAKDQKRQKELAQKYKVASEHKSLNIQESYESILKVDQFLKSFSRKNVIMQDNATIITADDKFSPVSKYIPMEDFKETYSKMDSGFFRPLIDMTPDAIGLDKVKTGDNLIQEVRLFNEMIYSFTHNNATQNLAQLNKINQDIKKEGRIFVHDTETLGGINKYGRRSLDWMTEFYGADFVNDNGTIRIENEYNGLIGLPDRFKDKYMKIIDDYDQHGIAESGEAEVILQRLGLYGHRDTKFGYDANGNPIIKQFADPDKDYKYTKSELLEGYKRLRDTWDYNQSEARRGESGLQIWQENYAKYLNRLQDDSVIKIDQNGGLADTPWNNAMIQMEELDNDLFRQLAGLDETKTLRTNPNRHGDTLSAGRLGLSGTNINTIYNTAAKQRERNLSGKGPLALENIAKALLKEDNVTAGMGAHTAVKDAYQTARLVFEEIDQLGNKSFLDHTLELAARDGSKIAGTVSGGGQQLFFSPYSLGGPGAGKKGYMSFIYDSLNNAARTSGGANVGDVIKQDSFGQFPIRRNSFYTLDWAGQVAVTDQWRREIAQKFPEFNLGSLYVAKLNQVLDETVATADTRHNNSSFIVAESREELESYISRLAMVGQKDSNGKWQMLAGHEEEISKMLSVSQIRPDGKFAELTGERTIDEAIRAATLIEYNDKAARTAREFEARTYDRFAKFKSLIEEVNGGAADRKTVNDIARRLLSGEEISVANQVAQGKVITLDTLKNALGFKDSKTQNQEWYSETVNKMLTSYEYFDSMMPIANEVLDQIGTGMSDADRAHKFQYTMKELMSRIAVDLKENDPKLAYSNTEAQLLFTKDTNRFVMDVSEMFDTKVEQYIDTIQGIQDAGEMTINLNDKDGNGLIKSIMQREGIDESNIPASNKNAKALESLQKFVRNAQGTKDYGKIFEGLDAQSYGDSLMLSRDIMGRLNEARLADPEIGRPSKEYIFNAMNPHAVAKSKYVTDRELLKSTVRDVLTTAPTRSVIKSTDTQVWRHHAENILSRQNEHLFKSLTYDGKTYNDMGSFAKAMGYGKFEQQYLSRMYNQVQEEYTDYLTNLLSNLGRVEGGEIIYDNKDIVFRMNNQQITFGKLPIINFENGQISMQVGGNKVALHNVIDIDGVINNSGYADLSKVKLSTNFKKAIGEVYPKGLERYLNSGGNVFDWIASAESSIQRNITKGSPGFTDSNLTELEKSLHVKDSEVKKLLPAMKRQGLLNGLDKKFVDSIHDNMSEYMNSELNQYYQANRAEIIKILSKYSGDIKPLVGNISSMVKANDIGDNFKVGGTRTNALIQFQDFRRDVPGQERAIMFDKEYVTRELVAKHKDARVGSYINTSVSSKLRNRNMGGIMQTGIDVTMNNLNMSDPMLREMILRVQSDPKYQGALGEKTFEKVVNKIKNMSLVEGSAILDPRVADIAFNYSDIQRISMDKILTDMNSDLNTIQQKERFAKLMPQFELVNGEMKVKLSNGSKIKRRDIIPIESNGSVGAKLANHDGTLNVGWFIEGTDLELSESQINSVIKNTKTADEALKLLNSKYKGYATIKYDSLPEYIKTIQDGGEKNMTYIPRFGIGELDDSIMAYMMESNQEGLLRQVIDYQKRKQMIRWDKAIGEQYGFNNEKDFWKAFEKERYAAFDTFKDVVKDSIYNVSNIDFSIVSANGLAKHNNFGSIFRHNVNAMVQAQMDKNGKTEVQALDFVLNQLKTGIDGKTALVGMSAKRKGKELIFDSTLGEEAALDIEVMKQIIKQDETYADIGKQLLTKVETKDGSAEVTVGTVSRASLSQVKDYQNVTGREQEMQAVKDLNLKANTLMSEAMTETDPNKKRMMLREADALKEQAIVLEQAIKGEDKGRRISDRDMLMYSYDKYSDGYIEDLRRSIGDDAKFEQLAGDLLETQDGKFVRQADGSYKLKESLIGKAANQHLIEERHKGYFIGNAGDKLLRKGDDLSIYKDRAVREGIARILDQKDVIRKDLAEVGYALHQGARAQGFKKGKYSIDEMKEAFGFNTVKINELSPHLKNGATEMLADEHASLGKNILLDLGENFGDATNARRYVAMPYMPVKRIQDDVIRADFEKKVNGILYAKRNLDYYGTKNATGKTLGELKANLLTKVDEYYEALNYHLSGKETMFGTYSAYRIAGQTSTKTSSGTIYTPDKMREFFSRKGQMQTLTESWMSRLDAKDYGKLNYDPFSRAKFDGKTLLEHANEGRMIDAKFMGIEAFKKQGVFDKDFMAQFGFTGDGAEEEMMKLLETEGIMGEVTRTPNIKTGSSTRSMLYLDRTLEGNRAVVTTENQIGMVGDNDGDFSVTNNLVYKKEYLDADGKKQYKEVAYSQARLDAGDIDADEMAFWNEAKRSIYYKAGTSNQHWRETVLNTLEKEQNNAIKGSTLDSIMDSAIDGKILPELAALDQGADIEKRLRDLSNLEEAMTSSGFDFDKGDYKQLDNWITENVADQALAQDYRQAVVFDIKHGKAQNTGMAKMLRSAIGEANVPMHKARQSMYLSLLHNTVDDIKTSSVMQKAFEGIEQDVISYKKIDSMLEAADRVATFRKAFSDITSGQHDRARDGRITMGEWIDQYASGVMKDTAKELSRDSNFKEFKIDWSSKDDLLEDIKANVKTEAQVEEILAAQQRVAEQVKEQLLDGMSSIDNAKLGQLKDIAKLGTATNAATASGIATEEMVERMYRGEGVTLTENLLELANAASPEEYKAELIEFDKSHYLKRADKAVMDDGLNYARQNSSNTVKSILEDTGSKINHYLDDAMKNLTKSKFGAGALAFGAMFMFTGYMGGKPSEPAMDQSTNMAANEQGPMLSDFNMPQQSVPRQTNSGYVINIKGKGSPVAVQQSLNQIQQTAHQSFSTDVNVSMNITQSPGNIDDRTIEQMISDAIG